MSSSEREKAIKRFLHDACVQLGFCIPPADQDRLIASPHFSATQMVEAVIKAEGIEPIHLESYEHLAGLMALYQKNVPEQDESH
ncbi:hypothetical protein [uncultured Litoreibacter sp.]|uniref:hypothetical protein n=1 Tax=uncultured Litoreibacter sp. TaxID=1392394 RepID=UPI0026114B97|nr:hypothetical protein [uncultured Litoreibacter sp.]